MATCSDHEFVSLFKQLGAAKLSKRLKISVRAVYTRRINLERKFGRQITGPTNPCRTRHNVSHPQRVYLEIPDGVVIVGSDAHYWPGQKSTAHRAFVKFCKDMRPRAVVMNGDVMDFPQISRHPPIGWEKLPTVKEEIAYARERLVEIENAAPKARKIWTLGNHDSRFETRLATVAPEFAKVYGIHLRDHFPSWEAGWSCWINDSVVVKHRYKGGIHATHNNAVSSGKHMITGHLHSAKVTPLTDYNGTRYGVDTGCMADIYSPQFNDYLEDSPRNWRSAFAVLTFRKGRLLLPELALTFDETHVEFRGEVIKV